MKIIQLSALFTLLSTSSPLAHASEESSDSSNSHDVVVIQKQDDVKDIITVTSSNHLLRGAANSAWNFLIASDADGGENNNDEDVMASLGQTCNSNSDCLSLGYNYYCCAPANGNGPHRCKLSGECTTE